MRILDTESFLTLDPGWENSDPDPQHYVAPEKSATFGHKGTIPPNIS